MLSPYLQIWPARQFLKTLQNLDYHDNLHHNDRGIELTTKSPKILHW